MLQSIFLQLLPFCSYRAPQILVFTSKRYFFLQSHEAYHSVLEAETPSICSQHHCHRLRSKEFHWLTSFQSCRSRRQDQKLKFLSTFSGIKSSQLFESFPINQQLIFIHIIIITSYSSHIVPNHDENFQLFNPFFMTRQQIFNPSQDRVISSDLTRYLFCMGNGFVRATQRFLTLKYLLWKRIQLIWYRRERLPEQL